MNIHALLLGRSDDPDQRLIEQVAAGGSARMLARQGPRCKEAQVRLRCTPYPNLVWMAVLA